MKSRFTGEIVQSDKRADQMMQEKPEKSLWFEIAGEWFLCTAVLLALYLFSGIFPLFLFILPAPLILFSSRRGFIAAFSALIALSVFIASTTGIDNPICFLVLLAGGPGCAVAPLLLRKKDKVIQLTAILVLIPMILVPSILFAVDKITSGATGEILTRSYTTLETNMKGMLTDSKSAGSEGINAEKMLANVKWLIFNLYSALFTAIALTASLISLALADRYSQPLTGTVLQWFKFRNFKLPELAAVFFIISGLGTLFSKGTALFVSRNLLTYTIFVFMLQGIALSAYLFHTFAVRPLFQTLMYLAFFFLPAFPFILAALGMLEIWVPIRRKINELHQKLSGDVK